MNKPLASKLLVSAALVIGTVVWSAPASAVPAFARKYQMQCSSCHLAFPQLNSVGRRFKEAGYRFPSDEEQEKTAVISDLLELDKHVPISAILVTRPYDKKDSGNSKIRALHELELIVAGIAGKSWSGYAEIEAEDETGFDPEIAPLVLTYNHNQALNLQFSYGPMFWADPYGFLGDHFRLTRGHVGAIDQRFGGGDGGGRFRGNRQMIGVYGRPQGGKVFYNVGVSGAGGDPEGESPKTLHGRLAFDVSDDIMIGGFVVDGEDGVINRNFSRYGIDFSADVGDARLQGLYIKAKDDFVGTLGEEDNDALSIQGMYVFKDETGHPTWVPLIRYDTYETANGAQSFDELTFNLSYYFTQNVKGFIEYWDRIDAPTPAQEDTRITVQGAVGF